MKAMILAGGSAIRISEESAIKPKPILSHIMKVCSRHGINDFVIRLGYKGRLIKEYFANYFFGRSDVRFDLKINNVEFLSNCIQPRPGANVHADEDGEHELARI